MTTAGNSPVIGILGLGAMGGALAIRLAQVQTPALQVFGRSPNARVPASVPRLASARELAATSDILVVAVKPYHLRDLAESIRASLRPGTIVISLAAGVPLTRLVEWFGAEVRVVRAMPNVAAEVGASVTALVSDDAAALDAAEAVFAPLGIVVRLAAERLMHAFIGVAGSAPAFAFVFAEALADGAVAEGMPRVDARRAAAAMLRGAAQLLESSTISPAEWKDRVASPGGTTIEGLAALEQHGLRFATIEAVRASARRSRQMEGGA